MVGADLRAALRERLRLASRVFTSFGRDHGFQGRAGTRFFMGGMASVPSHFSPCFLLLLRHRNDQPDGTEGTKSRKAFLQILVGEPGRTEDRRRRRPRQNERRAPRPLVTSPWQEVVGRPCLQSDRTGRAGSPSWPSLSDPGRFCDHGRKEFNKMVLLKRPEGSARS